MSSIAMSLLAKINNYAAKNNIAAQTVLQNLMFERFLKRLSVSEYKDVFVIKGGILVTSIVGLSTRSTMDLDTTLRNLPLTKEAIQEAIENISNIPLKDETKFTIVSIKPIRKDDVYGGYRVRIDATYDTIITPLSIDISIGDVITPGAVQHEFTGLFDEDLHFDLWAYNIETVLAEKSETILRRGALNTRPRDFYDVYILSKTKDYNKEIFIRALNETSKHRGSNDIIAEKDKILKTIKNSPELKNSWAKYQSKFSYARDIQYSEIMKALDDLLEN